MRVTNAERGWQGITIPAEVRPKIERFARFAVVGISSAVVQLTLLDGLVDIGWKAFLANALAFLVGSQVNFALSTRITWADRRAGDVHETMRRWMRFMGSIAGTAVINLGLFIVLLHWLPTLLASALATTLVAMINYTLGSIFIFKKMVFEETL